MPKQHMSQPGYSPKVRVKDFNYMIDGYFRRELESTTTARSCGLPGRGGGSQGSREISSDLIHETV